jgi:hypothetical protein
MTTRASRVTAVVAGALAGLVLAVALAILTSHLTTQHVGLAGEPLRPKSGLVSRPPARTTPAPSRTAPTHDSETEHGDD